MGRLLLRCLTHPTLRHPLPGALRPRPYPPPHATPLSLPVSRPRPPRPAHNHLSRPFQISPYYTHKALSAVSARDMGTHKFRRPRFLHSLILRSRTMHLRIKGLEGMRAQASRSTRRKSSELSYKNYCARGFVSRGEV